MPAMASVMQHSIIETPRCRLFVVVPICVPPVGVEGTLGRRLQQSAPP
jgi:hypothetical protein